MNRTTKKPQRTRKAALAACDELSAVSTASGGAQNVHLTAAPKTTVKSAGEYDWRVMGICAVLAILVFAVFGQTLRHDFVNYDDDWYVFQSRAGVKQLTAMEVAGAFTRKELGLWTPMVTVSHLLDCRLYGLSPRGHHLTNVVLHVVSVILLFLVVRQMTGALWRSAFMAALFAIHPLNVESVAWIAERKDVLSGLFFMLTLVAYLRYIRRPGSAGRYIVVVILFALGLMCKPMLVTLPFVLMLLDYWPLKRLFVERTEPTRWRLLNWRALAEKIPLLALSTGFCVITMIGGTGAPPVGIDSIPFWARMAEAPVWLVTYLLRMIWPAGMAVVYTHPEWGLFWWPVALALCVAISLGAFLLREKFPYLWIGWLWNVGMLAPVIGIVQVSRHARADHYNYLPQIGLSMALTWVAVGWAGERRHCRIVLGSAAVAVLCILSVVAWRQTSYWQNSETLWSHTLECTQDNCYAHYKLAEALRGQGRMADAMAQYRKALQINPDSLAAHYNLGTVLLQEGKAEEATTHFREALRIDPASLDASFRLGKSLLQLGRTAEAIADYQRALRINPSSPEAHYNLGNALLQQGQAEDAIAEYRKAVRISPDYEAAHGNLGNALLQQGRTVEAIAQLREILRINPASFEAHNNIGEALLRQGRMEEAIAEYREALRINPACKIASDNLGEAMTKLHETNGRSEEVQ